MKALIDIGAHFGEGAERLIRQLGIDATWAVHHFEPNPVSMTTLMQNTLADPIPRKYHCLAVGETAIKPFYLQRDIFSETEYTLDGYGSCLSDSGSTERGLSVSCTVCSVNLATVFGAMKHDEYHVKIDIEGTEYALDWQAVPAGSHCYVEWHPFGCDDPNGTKRRIIASRPDIVWHEWD